MTKKDDKRNGEMCIHDGCTEWSGHKSGLCETHRKAVCIVCGKTFTWSEPLSAQRPKCASCRRKTGTRV